MIIPRQVYNEISVVNHLQQRIDLMVNNGNLIIEDLLVGSEENNLYLDLTVYTRTSTLPLIGKGEAAAIALSKKNNGILASNNFRDVKFYVELYGLNHISNADIMYKAYNDGLISITDADSIWIQMVLKKRRLPFGTFTDYLNSLNI